MTISETREGMGNQRNSKENQDTPIQDFSSTGPAIWPFQRLGKVWATRGIGRRTKIRLFKTLVRPVLLYDNFRD